MAELLEQALALVDDRRAGEEVEVVVGRSRQVEVVGFHGAVESLTQAEEVTIGVRVLVAGRIGFATVDALDPAAARDALWRARENAELVEADPDAVFAVPDDVAPVVLELVDETLSAVSLDRKIATCLDLERACRAADPRICDVQSATYGELDGEVAIASSTGVATQVRSTRAWLFLQALAADGRGVLSTGFASSGARGFEGLDADRVAHEAASRALRGIDATKPVGREVQVRFEPRCAQTLLGLWAGALSGLALARRRSMFVDRLGERVAPSWFSLVDDPTDGRSLGATPVDGEGLATRPHRLIEGGVAAEALYDAYAARLAGRQSNAAALRAVGGLPAPGARAVRVEAPRRPVAELDAAGDVLVVRSLSGVHSGTSLISGDFSVGIEGELVGPNGAQPVREATISGNLQRMLLDLAGVGDDEVELPSGTRAASLLVGSMTLAGR
ncbi:peptidase U62 modulator of DNA gyrase [Acidimicrobium ferrooxidans DSM 10331]|uniref:Peptidase U62 modulator of DNA gyrase n=1 Tax=Acidimicrobium ferrooxidans (strain DSM 10331 / JCM 15462 / NBRC 103882 / ICP) TaxID=525909 RepID=C7M346_ACIFD|nr:TldD/PmbA family protein [Acidimicrobium ferrooxidans]ACU53440.1 peptidase U62 modulator of DNA gyrase [Acidimicrobium ferrooxidans DSM 10331]